ncbi:MAG: ComEA family DNA-binding protein [Trinickia sp.]|jgi:competence ComEA-like helix-hairpin-helix protein
MLKKLVLLFAMLAVTLSTAFGAVVDVNTADRATLETLKGIGPVKSQAIIDERTKHGPFADADDLARRVKGLGAKSIDKLEAQGLTIGGPSTSRTGVTHPQPQPHPATASPALVAAPSASASASPVQESKSKKNNKHKSKKNKTKAASAASGA